MEKNAKWLKGVLNTNGYTLQDLQDQTGLSGKEIDAIADDEPVSEDVWNRVLSTVNEYPALDYPSAQILQDLQNAIDIQGKEGTCTVYYGVSAGNLIFTGFTLDSTMETYGASENLNWLNRLQLSLQEALELFTKQNCTLNA